MHNIKNRLLSLMLALSMILAVGLPLASTWELLMPVKAADRTITNVAQGKTVVASSEYDASWAASLLTDGIMDNGTAWIASFEAAQNAENVPVIVDIDLADTYTISSLNFGAHTGLADIFPKGFEILYSKDATGENFQFAKVVQELACEGNAGGEIFRTVELGREIQARRIRLFINKTSYNTGGIWLGFSEIEVMGYETPDDEISEARNVAIGMSATASSTVNAGWASANLINGNAAGWLATFEDAAQASPEKPVDVVINLWETHTVSAVTIVPNRGLSNVFPSSLQLQYSPDVSGDNWINIGEAYTNLWLAYNGSIASPLTAEFDPIEACRIRVRAIGPSGNAIAAGQEYLGYGEIEVEGIAKPKLDMSGFVNVAKGKTASINNANSIEAYAANGWGIKALTDGIKEYSAEGAPYYQNNAWLGDYSGFGGSTAAMPTILTIDLGGEFDLGGVKLYPFAGTAFSAALMPSDYTIEVYSVEDNAWVAMAADAGVWAANGVNTPDAQRTAVLEYPFSRLVKANKIRVSITKDSTCDLGTASMLTAIGEIEAMADMKGAVPQDKIEYGYSFQSPAQATPPTQNGTYAPRASSNSNQYYILNRMTVADGVSVKSFNCYLNNADSSAKTVTFVVAAWNGNAYNSLGDSNANAVIKQTVTVAAGFAGFMEIEVPAGVTIGAGTWLYGFNNASSSRLYVGRCSGTSANDANVTWSQSYYGRIRSTSTDGSTSASYKILSYVTYEKNEGEEYILPGAYTKLTEEKAHVIIIGGQSNATGNSRVTDLSADLQSKYAAGFDNVLISVNRDEYVTGNVVFEPVKLGQGRDTTMFGPEVGLADYLTTNFPGEKFYIIKAAYSGTNLYDQWDALDDVTLGTDGIMQGWYWFLFTLEVQEALDALVAQGLDPEIFSMLWMQGESDSVMEHVGNNFTNITDYKKNESELFTRIQKRFAGYASPNGIAFVDAAIYGGAQTPWTFHELVNIAKKANATASQNYYFIDPNLTDIDTRDHNNDLAHYDADDMIELGLLFGQGVGTILNNAGEKLAKNESVNVTRGKTVTASNSFEGGILSATYLTDGRYAETDGAELWSIYSGVEGGYQGTMIHRGGWAAISAILGGADPSPTDPYYLTIDLGGFYEIDTLKVMPGNAEPIWRQEFSLMPQAYQLQVFDGNRWVTVATETNVHCDSASSALVYNLETPVVGSEVRMVITAPGKVSNLSLVGEIEAYGIPAAQPLPPSEPEEENPNVAYGKPVISNNTLEGNGFSAGFLTDGSQKTGWHNGNYSKPADTVMTAEDPTRITIDLQGLCEITQVIIRPADITIYSADLSLIPARFDIQVTSNGQSWKTIHSVNGANCTLASGESLVYDLGEAVVAKQIRLNIVAPSAAGSINVIGEIEAIGVKAPNAKIDPLLPNVALDKTVSATDSIEDNATWSQDFLTDGVKFVSGTGGWHVQHYGVSSVETPTTITIDLGRKYKISQVAFAPNMIYSSSHSGMPRDFDIQVSVDGDLWVTVAKIRDNDFKVSGTSMLTFEFNEVDAVLVRVVITKDSTVTLIEGDPNSFASTFGEIEVYGEIYKVTIPDTELLPEAGQAGLDSGIVRDETQPKKYVTLRFDDGITQDARVIEILKKYSVSGATFYLNTGLYGADWTDSVGASHIRYTQSQLADVYAGFDVGVHGQDHLALNGLTESAMIDEVQNNASAIAGLSFFGKTPVGMAYAGGDGYVDARVRNIIYNNTTMRYGMGTTSSHSFALPESFMNWKPTAYFNEAGTDALIDQFIQTKATTDMVLTLWGHSYEFDQFDSWDMFEAMIAKLAEAAAEEGSEIVFVTNAQFYQLFKNEIPSMPITVDDANDDKVVDVSIIGDGYDIYQVPTGGKGYRYGAQYLYEGNTIHAYFSAVGTGYIDEWDWIAYRRSDDGGATWTKEKMVLAPSMGTSEDFSVCDPAVVKAGEYYYIAYTSTLNSVAMCNNVYIARSKNPDGPFDKWTGEGWGGMNPKPIFYYDGDINYYGIGEPSMVVKGNTMYLYYTYIGSNDLTQDYCMVATADLSDENWPANIKERGVATRKANNWFASDSLDVKYIEDYGKFIAIGTGNRFTTNSELAFWESTDGINFDLVDVVRQYTYVGLHNVALSSRVDGHINIAEDADKLCVVYAYDGVGKGNQSADGSTWGKWNTRVQPISIGLSVGNNMRRELVSAAMPEGAAATATPNTDVIMIRVSTTDTTSTANPVIMYDQYAMKVGATTTLTAYTLAYSTSSRDIVWTRQSRITNWTVTSGDERIATATIESNRIQIVGKAAGVTYVDLSNGTHTTRFWVSVSDTAPSSSTVLSVAPLRDQYTFYWGDLNARDMAIRVGITYTDYSYVESYVDESSPAVTYSGYDESIITIDSKGMVTPVGIGKTTVTITCKGVSCTVPVEITLDANDSMVGDNGNSAPSTVACDHADVVTVVTDPTCTAPGFTTHTCQKNVCGYTWIDSYVDALGHTAESTYDPATGTRTYADCERCGKAASAITFKTEWSRDVEFKLGEGLKMYYYAWIDASVAKPVLKVERNGKTYTVAGTAVQTRGNAVEYRFVFEEVTPDDMAAQITAKLYCDGYELLTNVSSFKQYIDDYKAGGTIDVEGALLESIEIYGAALEQVKSGATDSDVVVENFTEVVATDKKVTDNGNLGSFKYATVGFGSDVRLIFQFEAAEGIDVRDLTFKIKINGGAEIVVAADMIRVDGNTVKIYTDAIAATNLDDVYTVTAYNGATKGASFAYSVKSYVYAFQSATGESEAQIQLVKALYNYGLSAKAYADAQ